MKQIKNQINNVQIRKSGEISSRVFEGHNNYVRHDGCHINTTAAEMAMTTMILCPYEQNALSHWKYVLYYWDKCVNMVIQSQ